MRINYCLGKHPSLPSRIEIRRMTRSRFGATPPLEYFVEEWENRDLRHALEASRETGAMSKPSRYGALLASPAF